MRTLRSLITVASLVALVLAISLSNGVRTAAQTSSQFPAGLVAWWPADGNALDVVGSNNGTLLNGTTFALGKVSQAFSLDGVDDIIDLGANNIIGSGNMPFSVAMWIYPTSVPETGFYYFTIRLKQDTQFFIAFTNDFSNRKIHPYPSGEVDLAQLRVRSQSGRADETSKRQSPSSKALLPSRAHPMSALSPCFEACLPLVAEAHGLFERALPGDECRLLVPQPQVPRGEAETKVFFASRPRVDGAWQ